jgi:protein-S-isoprenylcysteine O-methyltransferase Ste14
LPRSVSRVARPPASARLRAVAKGAAFVERYILSLVYLALAGSIAACDYWKGLGWVTSGEADFPTRFDAVADVLVIVFQFLIGWFLLLGRQPSQAPRNLREFLVPMATAFFYLLYDAISWFPPAWRQTWHPTPWPSPFEFRALSPMDATGLVLGVVGAAITLWGVVTLRRSFGIFVSVREVVLRGPYRFVRHPIYLGYVLGYVGWALVVRTPALTSLVAIHLGLFVWRARLEENRLAAHSPAYRANMQRTGFLVPRLFAPSVD